MQELQRQQQPGIIGRGRMPVHSLLNGHRMKKPLLTCMKARGRKCRIVSIPGIEEVQRDQLARANEDANADLHT
jgi:hypothetical protein